MVMLRATETATDASRYTTIIPYSLIWPGSTRPAATATSSGAKKMIRPAANDQPISEKRHYLPHVPDGALALFIFCRPSLNRCQVLGLLAASVARSSKLRVTGSPSFVSTASPPP